MIAYIKKFFENNRKTLRYKDYDVNAFLKDEFFKKWVLYNDMESRHFWDKWLANNPKKTKEVLRAKEIICSIDYKDKVEIAHDDYLEIYEKIIEETPTFHKSKRLAHYLSLKNFAAVLIAFILAIFSLNYFQSSKPQIGAQSRPTLVTKQTQVGNKLTFYLSDGTKVKLNSKSQLVFPPTFEDSVREVYLKGEAFFEVSENKETPFIVKGEYLEARVLGTSFNFNTEKGKHEIALVSGKLRVSDSLGNTAMLDPAQMVSYANGKLKKQHFDTLKKTAWAKGIIYFDYAAKSEIFETLENWYGVDIIPEDDFEFKGKFSGSFNNEPLVRVLDVLSKASGFTYKLTEDQVFLYDVDQHPR